MTKKILLIFCFFASICSVYGQLSSYRFMQEVTGISNQWHSLQIPSATFKHLNPSLNDVRIYGVTNKDTIEVPYLLTEKNAVIDQPLINFSIINQSKNSKGFYYTFALTEPSIINQIFLNFGQQNFNFKVKLEGSHHQKEWFTVLDNYQLIGVQNQFIDFSFSTLNFKPADYKYYRLLLKTADNPNLLNSSIVLENKTEALQDAYPVEKWDQTNDSKSKKTTLTFNLKEAVPVTDIHLAFADTIDFYRPYNISYLIDSVKTEKGYIYNYRRLNQGAIHSFAPTVISFNRQIASHFKIEIDNQDNLPVTIAKVQAKGNQFWLTARFTEKAKYYFAYGNPTANFPQYDIAYFKDKIPESLSPLALGEMNEIAQITPEKQAPLFANSAWMYGILAVIMALLAYFSLKMLRQTKDN